MKRKAVLLPILFGILLVVSTTATTYAACTAITSLPKTIASAGNYCLTGNLTTSSTGTSINISSDDVVLDLAGWQIKNKTKGEGDCIGFTGSHKNVTIKNGNIVDFRSAIFNRGYLNNSGLNYSNIVVDGISFIFGGGTVDGIRIGGDRMIVRNCSVDGLAALGGNGIVVAGTGISIINNTIFDAGIRTQYDGDSVENSHDILIENNRITCSSGLCGYDNGITVHSESTMVINNRIMTGFGIGLSFDPAVYAGLYRDNLILNCTTNYSAPASFDAGNNK